MSEPLVLTSATDPATCPAPSGPVLVFDSGLGGLTVLGAIQATRPEMPVVYVADDAGFPYGALEEAVLVARVVSLFGRLIETVRPSLVVIACHTASTLVLPALRARFTVPFVGTVPAVKPAAAATTTGLVSVLATPGTVARDYTKALIREFAGHCEVTLVGSRRLAGLAEAHVRGEPVADDEIAAEIAPCFVTHGERHTDVVALACTHYPWLLDRLAALAPWNVTWIDPAPAIARRVTALLGETELAGAGGGRFVFTSGGLPPQPVRDILARYGLSSPAQV